jgi:serine/threonine-protein kinase
MERADWAEIERFVELGSTLNGKYQVERVLGVGGMGAVVLARHDKLGEPVAIKFLLPRAIGQGRHAQRFLREARAASRIRSAHVARVFDVDVRADGTPFIVMEYLVGETLAARIKRTGAFDVERAVDEVLEACEALAEAHALGIVHRDLKPANLFLARGAGNIELMKVLDFGISKVVTPDSPDGDSTTGDGFVGSPPYMSPEQLTHPASVDRRTDIWSLGIILYNCLTGRAPFKADTVGQVLASILQGHTPSVVELRPEVPVGLSKAIERCMARERDARYPDIASLSRALAAYASERGRRALKVIEAVATGQGESAPSADPARFAPASVPAPPATTRPGLDTGTLSAAADSMPRSGAAPRLEPRVRATIFVVTLGVIGSAVAYVNTRRASEAPLPSAAMSQTSPAPALSEPSPPVSAALAADASPPPVSSSTFPPASAKPKIRAIRAPAAPPATSRGFDPVFDERR